MLRRSDIGLPVVMMRQALAQLTAAGQTRTPTTPAMATGPGMVVS